MLMETFMRATGWTTRLRALASTLTWMEPSMKDIGKRTSSTVKVRRHGPTTPSMMETI